MPISYTSPQIGAFGDSVTFVLTTNNGGTACANSACLQRSVVKLGTVIPVATVAVTLGSTSIPFDGTTTATGAAKEIFGTTLSDRSVTWTSSDATVASIDAAGNITAHKAGSVTITATAAVIPGSASTVTGTASLTVTKKDQTINAPTPAAPGSKVYGGSFDVAATATSGLAVSITVSGGCEVTAGGPGAATIKMTSGKDACEVKYNQAGNTDFYNAATEVKSTTTAAKAEQSITASGAPTVATAFGSKFTVTASAAPSLAVSIASSGSCTGGGNGSAEITISSGSGTCTLKLNQGGNDDYLAASEVVIDVTAKKASQSITVTSAAPAYAASGSTFSVNATASSTLPVDITTAGCASTGSGPVTVTMGSTACTVTYKQAGNTDYEAAADVTSTTQPAIVSVISNFFAPVTTGNNSAKAGQTIPLKLRLTPNPTGVTFVAESRACVNGSWSAEGSIASADWKLQPDGSWQNNWKTPGSLAGKCVEVKVVPSATGYVFTQPAQVSSFTFR
jgi:hypothetical protein